MRSKLLSAPIVLGVLIVILLLKAIVIGSLPYTNTQDTTTARNNGDPESACVSPIGHTIWSVFTPATDMTITANTFGSTTPDPDAEYDTVLAVFTRADNQFTEIDCNDDTCHTSSLPATHR